MTEETTFAALYCTASAEGGRSVGIACVRPRLRNDQEDKKMREVAVYDFLDTERYANTESLLVALGASHIYFADTLAEPEMKKLEQMLEAAELAAERVSKSAFGDSDVLESVRKLHGSPVTELDMVTPGLKALAGLVKKGSLLDDSDDNGKFLVHRAAHDSFMKLDSAALRALNLFTTARDAAAVPTLENSTATGTDGAASAMRVTSLHGLLSYGCKTKGGKRLIRQWILQPLRTVDAIRARQHLVGVFVTSASLRRAWKDSINIPDLEALAGRLNRKNCTLLDLLRLYQFSLTLPNLVTRLKDFDGEEEHKAALQAQFINKLEWAASEMARYMEMCEQVIEDVASPEPRINPTWDPELKDLAEEREKIEGEVLDIFTSAKSGWGAELDGDLKCERDKLRGFVFRTRRTNEKALRNIPGIHICQVLKDGIHFTTTGSKGLKNFGERILDIESSYENKSRAVVSHALDIARSYTPVLEAASGLISALDAYYAFAHIAVSAPGKYTCPAVTATADDIKVVSGRHPVMEMQENATFIANDYIMSKNDSAFHIITGPNMGGKSTYIRTLGAIAVLAQIGSYVPAEEATLPIFDSICARIGAGDKAVKGVSTFMAEMLEASSIMSTATENSLVIIDELGRGTSTYDGFGLAWAISEHLTDKLRCFTLFATHFHELTALSQSHRSVKNFHVSAHTTEDSITMLYSIKEGPCPSSFGIHVAELAAFPAPVIAAARSKAAALEATSAVTDHSYNPVTAEKLRRFQMRAREDLSLMTASPPAKRARLTALLRECDVDAI